MNPRVGIISQTMVQQHHLRQLVEECGYEVTLTWLVNQLSNDSSLLDKADTESADIWLVDVDTFGVNQTESILSFERWLFALNKPIIFGEGSTFNVVEEGFQSWVRQLKSKLISASSQLALQKAPQTLAREVWVLAASTGGPEAVREFLDNIPSGEGIAFIYAQHIETGQHRALANTIVRTSRYSGRMAEHGDQIIADTVTVVPSNQQLDLLADGTLVLREQPWRGDYRPSIDQVVAMVSNCFGARSGVIFFSGMGDDGVAGARLMTRRGGSVWIQSPSTCTSDSMPSCVQKTGCSSQMGSPKQLAKLFKQYVKQRCTTVV